MANEIGTENHPIARLPPHSRDAETSLLGSLIRDKNAIGEAVMIVSREAFYHADHQIIFDALIALYEENRPIDLLILREELEKRQLLREVGGEASLHQLLAAVPSAAHAVHYAEVVRARWLLRCAIWKYDIRLLKTD